MERRRTRAALTMSIIFTIYLLNVRHPPHPTNPTQPTSLPKKIFTEDFQGEDDKANLLTIHLQNNSDSSWVLEVKKYKGLWKSDLEYIVRVHFPDFVEFQASFDRNASEIRIEPKSFKLAQNYEFFLKTNEKIDELQGDITGDGEVFLKFSSHSIVRNDVYNTKLCYGLAVSLLYIGTIAAMLKHYKACTENIGFAEQTSMLSLGLILVYEFTFAMWQLHKAFSDRVNTGVDFILIAAFWAFSCFMLVYTRIMVRVFEAGINLPGGMGDYTRARITSNFQTRVFFIVFFCFMLIVFLSKFYFVSVPLMHAFFLPQIVQNSIYGYKNSFSIVTVTIVLVSKGLVAGYFLLYGGNFVLYEPDLYLFGVVLGILGLQGAVLYWQRFKPRFLVPRKYRPLRYDYFRSKQEEAQLEGLDNTCNICMTPLGIGKSNEPVVNFCKTMHTPCNHRYHKDCLLHWMEIKMECPTCRSKLPVFEEE